MAGSRRVSIRWLGHACFHITFSDSERDVVVVTDPFRKGMGYADVSTSADVVTISHSHSDHDQVGGVTGDPLILRGLTEEGDWADIDETVGPVSFRVVGTYHDPDQGARRGRNACFVMEGLGLRLVHLGDLGHVPDAETVERMGQPDVLFIPVGGYFTIGAQEALDVVSLLGPRICVPMHYRTAAIKEWPIKPADEFLSASERVKHLDSAVLEPGGLPADQEVWVFGYT